MAALSRKSTATPKSPKLNRLRLERVEQRLRIALRLLQLRNRIRIELSRVSGNELLQELFRCIGVAVFVQNICVEVVIESIAAVLLAGNLCVLHSVFQQICGFGHVAAKESRDQRI